MNNLTHNELNKNSQFFLRKHYSKFKRKNQGENVEFLNSNRNCSQLINI